MIFRNQIHNKTNNFKSKLSLMIINLLKSLLLFLHFKINIVTNHKSDIKIRENVVVCFLLDLGKIIATEPFSCSSVLITSTIFIKYVFDIRKKVWIYS